jgi:hypothetical protein
MNKPRYVNTTYAAIGFVVFLTFGFVWSSMHSEAPFTAYMEGLVLALFFITGKRLAQKWQGKDKGFTNVDQPKQDTEEIPIR